jgi:hypothetical protein
METSAICSVDSGRSWADAIAVQWTAKALRLKINVWGEDSHANPPITQMYDYSNGIEYRVINLAWVTFRLGVGHYEPIAHSKLDLEVVKLTNPAKTMSTDVQVTQPYEIPKDFSTQEKVVKRLLGEEMSVVRETMRRLLGNHLFCDMKSAEKIKAVIRACPPHIQVKLTHKKVKKYFKNLEVVHTSLQEEHALANKAREIDQSQPHNSEAVLAETGEEEEVRLHLKYYNTNYIYMKANLLV